MCKTVKNRGKLRRGSYVTFFFAAVYCIMLFGGRTSTPTVFTYCFVVPDLPPIRFNCSISAHVYFGYFFVLMSNLLELCS